jgi:hypothetical protein
MHPDASPLLRGLEERTSRSYHNGTTLELQGVFQHAILSPVRAVRQAGLLPHGAPHPPGEPPAAAGAKLLPLAHRPLLPLAYRLQPSAAPALEIPHKPALYSRVSLPPADPGPGALLARSAPHAPGGAALCPCGLPSVGKTGRGWVPAATTWTRLHRRRHLGAACGAPPDAPGVDRRSRLRPAQ